MGSPKHVILVPFPAQGHVLPGVYLARKLAAQGLSVTIINIDSIHENLTRTWKHIEHQDIRLESIPMRLKAPKGFGAENLNDATAFMDAIYDLEEALAALLEITKLSHPVSCVISDFYHLSAPLAAARAGIPSVCFWSGAAAWASIHYSHSSLAAAGLCPVEDSDTSKLVSNLPGLKPFRAEYLPSYYRKEFYEKSGGGKYFSLSLRRVEIDSCILANSIYELEPQVFDAMQQVVPGKFVSVGPLFPLKGGGASEMEASLRPESRESLEWLDNQAPNSVLYVSFGSVASLTRAEMEELTQGLEASQKQFLMVASRDLAPEVNESFFREFGERLSRSGAGMVVSWVPQLAVLQHGSVGGFLTHCGWNSTLESMSNGVPMLGWPCHSDQNTNCKFILEDQEIGMELRDKTRTGISMAIRSLMASEEMRSRASHIERVAREAASENGSSYKNLHAFIHSLK
ncbi:UDP-glycosyltransferase 85A7 [Selaginella moellendorffii]|uniref:UDP-glycosyltransferase 85A7 n=1 Tax=Selaginella moellendorffii TaxID=88036 RepID=UPI000D1C5558|nr:UDP-glycosyltransferase 85A7 [Selaginella moellendorffii]|eukprot:XP_024542186.1 UDP-glycosyltransferase 85A7 [Selaginella moellendorffii]